MNKKLTVSIGALSTLLLASPAQSLMLVPCTTSVEHYEASDEPNTYIVREGDTLWEIAAEHLDNPHAYNKIAERNKISSPYVIFPDQKLILPTPKYNIVRWDTTEIGDVCSIHDSTNVRSFYHPAGTPYDAMKNAKF